MPPTAQPGRVLADNGVMDHRRPRDPDPRHSARSRMLAALAGLLGGLGLRACLATPSMEEPPAPPRCERWLQVGEPDAPPLCVAPGEEGSLLWAGLPPACLAWLSREPAEPGDRIVADRHGARRCRRERMAPGILKTLGIAVAVNRADAAELAILPGVGPALARRIVEERARGGPYRRARDLERVSGVGPRLAARLGPRLIF